MKIISAATFWMFLLLTTGCATIHQGATEPVSFEEKWVLLPFINNTETPYAAQRAESVTSSLLYARGVKRLATYPLGNGSEELFTDRGEKRQNEALEWARKNQFRYAVTGTVNEWRYKVGLDGEPVAGVTLQILELPEQRTLWSATGSKSGWSRDAVSAVAQQVIHQLLETVKTQ